MTDTEFLKTEQLKTRRKGALKRKRVCLYVFAFACAALAVACFIGLLVAVILLNFNQDEPELYYILTGAFAGGGAAFALLAYGFSKWEKHALDYELDFLERCEGDDCFFVGDGTLARFGEKELKIYSADGKRKDEIHVSYSEMRFFSVCNRRRPKSKGEWSVALEIPAHYLAKPGKSGKNDPPALVQADGKERLYRCLEERGLTLSGEKPAKGDGKKYTRLKNYKLPNAQKRRRALMFMGLGGVLTVLGIVLPLTLDNAVLAFFAAVGLVILGRAILSFCSAHATFAVYQEGIYFAESNGAQSTFLVWEEIEQITREEKKSLSVLRVTCAYGSYYFPDTADAYEYLQEHFAQKCGGDHA